jgi:hypothetical protein
MFSIRASEHEKGLNKNRRQHGSRSSLGPEPAAIGNTKRTEEAVSHIADSGIRDKKQTHGTRAIAVYVRPPVVGAIIQGKKCLDSYACHAAVATKA